MCNSGKAGQRAQGSTALSVPPKSALTGFLTYQPFLPCAEPVKA
jgi:hypothetical protein